MKAYHFYGWQQADVPAVTDSFAGIRTPRDLYDALSGIWSAETCAPRLRDKWSPENRTLGQCSVTAFLVQDIFGGKVYGIPLEDGGFHCYNAVGECVFDLTCEQFPGEKLVYTGNPEQLREEHFRKEKRQWLLRKELIISTALRECCIPIPRRIPLLPFCADTA